MHLKRGFVGVLCLTKHFVLCRKEENSLWLNEGTVERNSIEMFSIYTASSELGGGREQRHPLPWDCLRGEWMPYTGQGFSKPGASGTRLSKLRTFLF